MKEFNPGDCFSCKKPLVVDKREPTTIGVTDGIPVYAVCPHCRAINNYINRYRRWEEEQERPKKKKKSKPKKKKEG